MSLQLLRLLICVITAFSLQVGWAEGTFGRENFSEQSLLLQWPVKAPGSKHVTFQRWRIENTIVHFANHIYNNHLLASLILDDLLENGIPAQIINGEFRDQISAQELRASYQIPEEFWHDPLKKRVLKQFIRRFFLTVHDDAKLNTSKDFCHTYYPPPPAADLGGNPHRPYIIEHLHSMFGLNPWKIPDNAPPETVAHYTAAQQAVRLLNSVDNQVSVNYFATREEVNRELAPHWVARFILKLEKTVDTIERWGNPYSELELNRPTLPESQFEIKMGKITERPISNRNTNADEFPHRRLIVNLEQRYHSVAHPYEKFFLAMKMLFANLMWVGIEEEALHPLKKYQLAWILQNGERRPPEFNQKTLAWNIFNNAEKVRELFQPNATKALRNFDARTIKFHLGEERSHLSQINLFQHLSLNDFLHSASDLQYLEWKNLLWYLQERGKTEELELFEQWSKRFMHAGGNPKDHSLHLWGEKLEREVAKQQGVLGNRIQNCVMEILRLQLAF